MTWTACLVSEWRQCYTSIAYLKRFRFMIQSYEFWENFLKSLQFTSSFLAWNVRNVSVWVYFKYFLTRRNIILNFCSQYNVSYQISLRYKWWNDLSPPGWEGGACHNCLLHLWLSKYLFLVHDGQLSFIKVIFPLKSKTKLAIITRENENWRRTNQTPLPLDDPHRQCSSVANLLSTSNLLLLSSNQQYLFFKNVCTK